MPEIMTVNELAAFLRIHHTTVYRLIRKNSLPFFRVGADYRFRRQAIEQWMAKQQEEAK